MIGYFLFPTFNFMITTACVFVFTLVIHTTPILASDFRQVPLSAEKQAKLEALTTRLGSDSAQIREQAGREIIEFGSSATEALQKALESRDYTISDSARYYLRLLNQGLLRYNDSEKVREILATYETHTDSQRVGALYALAHLPSDEALPPLLRIVMNEENAIYARSAAVAVMWNLPFVRIYPEWSQPIPEMTTKYPNPRRWTEQNQSALTEREKLQAEIRRYLESEPKKTVGKTFLLELFALERQLKENLQESMARFTKLEAEYFEAMRKNPAFDGFLKDFIYFVSDLLHQTGNVEMGEEHFLQATKQYYIPLGGGKSAQENGRFALILCRFRNIQRLAARGHWEWAKNELMSLNQEMNPSEQARFSSFFVGVLRSLGDYESALKILQTSRRYFFLRSDMPKEETSQLNAQIFYFRILAMCKKSDYAGARKLIESALKEKTVDIDALILSRKLAQFQKDMEWERVINQRVDAELDTVKEKIENPSGFQNEDLIAHNCNTFAWLAGNTERRLDEALQYAEKALKLRPETPGLMDTLAMVHFVRGEKEKALDIQRKAHENAPNELDILQNLHRFEAEE